MSSCEERQSPDLRVPVQVSDVQVILGDVRLLRNQIVTAWRERGVVLTVEERELLHDEITQTCQFLNDLTRSR
jgi:hypothetical protein